MRTELLSGKFCQPRPSHFKAEDFKDPFLPDALGNFEAFIFVAVFSLSLNR